MPKRKPKGPEHSHVRPFEWYRTPLHNVGNSPKSHLTTEEYGDAICGRALFIDPYFWTTAHFLDGETYEEALGSWYLVVDQRKKGKCSQCKSGLKGFLSAKPKKRNAPGGKPYTPDTIERAKIHAKWLRMQQAQMLKVFTKAFPDATVVPR